MMVSPLLVGGILTMFKELITCVFAIRYCILSVNNFTERRFIIIVIITRNMELG